MSLIIKELCVEIAGREVLHDIDMEINPGETHVLFGKNGSGKTSLLMAIMGFSGYQITKGSITFKGRDITHLPINERANLGIGMAFQRPPTIRGLKTRDLVDLLGKQRGNGGQTTKYAESLEFTEFLDREINYGLSGGEIKKSELVQLMAQNP
ncbi:MAG TPA: ATP-binding cassette domain-containing protein, partial [Syntrophales bacterium]|nr:ATP-binding cassette domain-containing protein [Syntrophales bacterium]